MTSATWLTEKLLSLPTGVLKESQYAFEKRPLIAQGIAKCVAKWSEVEMEIGSLFILLLKANETNGAELYHALGSSKAKRDAIKTLALSSLTADSLRIVEALLHVVKGQQAIRDRIAHWVWFLSDELDDGMIFVDPKLVWQKIGRVRESIKSFRTRAEFYRTGGGHVPPEEIGVYRPSDLTRDAEAFEGLKLLVIKVTQMVECRGRDDARYARLYDELAGDGRLAEHLSRSHK